MAQNKKTTEINVNIWTDPIKLDPQLSESGVNEDVVNLIFEGLYRKDNKGLPVPAAAKSCDISNDGLLYTFHLRNTKWADGTKLTAKHFEDAWFRAIQTVATEYAPSSSRELFNCIKGVQNYGTMTSAKESVGIKVLDDTTLEVTLEEPTPHFLELITTSPFMPIIQEFYDKQPVTNETTTYGGNKENILGNGPYVIDEWKHGEQIVLKKNKHYWNNKKIQLPAIVLKMISDETKAINEFKEGRLDITDVYTPTQLDQYKKELPVTHYNLNTLAYISFNFSDPVFKNANIRKALSLALDRSKFINDLSFTASKATGAIPPSIFGENNSFRNESGELIQDFNVQQAKKFLQLGLNNLNLQKLPTFTILVEDNENMKKQFAFLQSSWRENLDIKVEMKSMTFTPLISSIQKSDYQMVLLVWSTGLNDPARLLDKFHSLNPENYTNYYNTTYNELLQKANASTDRSTRMSALRQAESILIQQDAVICPLYYMEGIYLINPRLKGVVRNGSIMQSLDLTNAYIVK